MNPLILDTDPGIDDAVAIAALLREYKTRVLFLLTSYGNTSLDNATKNALTILELLNSDIPVIRGASHSVNSSYSDASYIHGSDGLGGLQKADTKLKATPTPDYLATVYEAILAAEIVDYITLGPLTNLAALMKRYPDVIDHIESIVTMGGGLKMGNVTERAEFNIHCDAEAAEYVFENANNITMVPLNTTSKVFFTPPQIRGICQYGTELSNFMEKLLMENYNNCVRFGESGSTMHDSVAVLYYLHPELFSVEKCGITVDCGACYGETRKTAGRENATVTLDGNVDELLQKIASCIAPERKRI